MKKGYSIFLTGLGDLYNVQDFMPQGIENFFSTEGMAEYYLSYGDMELDKSGRIFVILPTYKES